MAQRLQNFLSAKQRQNRLWPWHFGTGFFDAPGHCGFLGSRPTHLELLDSLAIRFVVHNPMHNLLLLVKRAVKNTFAAARPLIGSVCRRSEAQIQRLALLCTVLVSLLLAPLSAPGADASSLNTWQQLVRTETWTERWPDESGGVELRTVTAEVWTQAFQAALDAGGRLHIPARGNPYYLDGPLVLKSGHNLTADAKAEIRLKPGTNTCMVRNERVLGFADKPVPEDTEPDRGIVIEGGIWSTMAVSSKERNGNLRGASSAKQSVPGTHGVILLHNVRNATVRNVTVCQSTPFAVHLGNIRDFTIDGVVLDGHGRDGVHVDGPARDGVIRNVSGDSHDDPVSLTAWDWKQYSVTFGPIHHVTVERISGAPEGKRGTDAIRLLPGVKRFSDGSTLDCPISDITLRNITDIRDFKLYDQPNLEQAVGADASVGIGTLKNIVFENLTFNRPGSIQVHANTDGLTVRDVRLLFTPAAGCHLVELGPKSMTYQGAPGTDPSRWREIFSPDLDCTVRNVSVTGIRTRDSHADLSIEQVVRVIEQKLNAEYPKSTPKGGTGKGTWIR